MKYRLMFQEPEPHMYRDQSSRDIPDSVTFRQVAKHFEARADKAAIKIARGILAKAQTVHVPSKRATFRPKKIQLTEYRERPVSLK